MVATVTVTEPLGDAMDVFLVTPTGSKLVARVAATEEIAPGQQVTVAIDFAHAHLFGPGDYGRNLLVSEAAPTAA